MSFDPALRVGCRPQHRGDRPYREIFVPGEYSSSTHAAMRCSAGVAPAAFARFLVLRLREY